MKWSTTLPFILDHVDGDLKIVYTPMGQKFYQNGAEIKRTDTKMGGLKYKVKTTDDGDNIVLVRTSEKKGRQIIFRGEKINQETPLSRSISILSLLPYISIAVVLASVIITTKYRYGIIYTLLFIACAPLGARIITTTLRSEKQFIRQLVYSIAISLGTTILFVLLALIFGIITGLILSIS